MEITKVELQKNNDYRYSIYIDDEFAFGITDELKYKYNLKKGLKLDQKLIDEILELESYNKAVNYVMYLLSFRMRSEKEIRDKLIEKEYMNHQIEHAIEYSKERNYINDFEFASSFVRDKTNLNKYGPEKIKFELYKKGISNSIISEVLEEYIPRDLEYENAHELAVKQVRKYSKDDKYKKYSKLSGYLYRKGYSFDIINSVVNSIISGVEE